MCLLGGMDRSGRVVQPYQGMDKVTAQSTTGNEHRHRATWVLAFVWGTTRLTPSIYVATWDDLCWRMTVSGAFGSTPRRYIKLPSSKNHVTSVFPQLCDTVYMALMVFLSTLSSNTWRKSAFVERLVKLSKMLVGCYAQPYIEIKTTPQYLLVKGLLTRRICLVVSSASTAY
ncbi:unnamed protein product [Toxocara canis]|uniref:Secreted protein n=1 Tax=Toxocara canis TaxID=6265 RepID=A0A183USF9_TOXCA|nr:unnamed protein product [Toxocara canis]